MRESLVIKDLDQWQGGCSREDSHVEERTHLLEVVI